MRETCFFGRLGYVDHDGRIDPMHFVPQRRIKAVQVQRGWSDDELKRILRDKRNIYPGCRRHHDAWDYGSLEVHTDDFPAPVWEFAREVGFYWNPERDGFFALAAVEGGS